MARATPTSGIRPPAPIETSKSRRDVLTAPRLRRNIKFGWRRENGRTMQDEREQAHILALFEHVARTCCGDNDLMLFSESKGFPLSRSTIVNIMSDSENQLAYAAAQKARSAAKMATRPSTANSSSSLLDMIPTIYEVQTRDVPVTVVRKFEDRMFEVPLAAMSAVLRNFALVQADLRDEDAFFDSSIEVKVEPVFTDKFAGEGDSGTPVFKGLKFTVTKPSDDKKSELPS